MKIKQLLLTTDFSENARRVYQSASSISRQFGATLHLVHFAGVAPSFIAKTSSETFYETHEQALRQEAATHAAFDGMDVTAHLKRQRWSPDQLRDLEKELTSTWLSWEPMAEQGCNISCWEVLLKESFAIPPLLCLYYAKASCKPTFNRSKWS